MKRKIIFLSTLLLLIFPFYSFAMDKYTSELLKIVKIERFPTTENSQELNKEKIKSLFDLIQIRKKYLNLIDKKLKKDYGIYNDKLRYNLVNYISSKILLSYFLTKDLDTFFYSNLKILVFDMYWDNFKDAVAVSRATFAKGMDKLFDILEEKDDRGKKIIYSLILNVPSEIERINKCSEPAKKIWSGFRKVFGIDFYTGHPIQDTIGYFKTIKSNEFLENLKNFSDCISRIPKFEKLAKPIKILSSYIQNSMILDNFYIEKLIFNDKYEFLTKEEFQYLRMYKRYLEFKIIESYLDILSYVSKQIFGDDDAFGVLKLFLKKIYSGIGTFSEHGGVEHLFLAEMQRDIVLNVDRIISVYKSEDRIRAYINSFYNDFKNLEELIMDFLMCKKIDLDDFVGNWKSLNAANLYNFSLIIRRRIQNCEKESLLLQDSQWILNHPQVVYDGMFFHLPYKLGIIENKDENADYYIEVTDKNGKQILFSKIECTDHLIQTITTGKKVLKRNLCNLNGSKIKFIFNKKDAEHFNLYGIDFYCYNFYLFKENEKNNKKIYIYNYLVDRAVFPSSTGIIYMQWKDDKLDWWTEGNFAKFCVIYEDSFKEIEEKIEKLLIYNYDVDKISEEFRIKIRGILQVFRPLLTDKRGLSFLTHRLTVDDLDNYIRYFESIGLLNKNQYLGLKTNIKILRDLNKKYLSLNDLKKFYLMPLLNSKYISKKLTWENYKSLLNKINGLRKKRGKNTLPETYDSYLLHINNIIKCGYKKAISCYLDDKLSARNVHFILYTLKYLYLKN